MSKIDIETFLEHLKPNELQKLKQLLHTVDETTPDEETTPKTVKPKHKRKRRKKADTNTQDHTQARQTGPAPQRVRSKTRKRIQKQDRHPKKGSACGIQNIDIQTERENIFLTQRQKMAPVTDEERKAIKFDKLVSSKNAPISRTRPSTIVEAKCLKCGYIEEIASDLVTRTKHGIAYYTCNDCLVNRR